MRFSLKNYVYMLLIMYALYASYKVYGAFKSKNKLIDSEKNLVISKNQIAESQKLFLVFREKVKTLDLKIKKDSLLIIEKQKSILYRDSLIKTKDSQILEIQKLILPIENNRKSYKDSLDKLKIEYKKLLNKSKKRGLFN
jgi:hypothetical protein